MKALMAKQLQKISVQKQAAHTMVMVITKNSMSLYRQTRLVNRHWFVNRLRIQAIYRKEYLDLSKIGIYPMLS